MSLGDIITSLDFDPTGNLVATIDRQGMCFISDIDTNRLHFDRNFIGKQGISLIYFTNISLIQIVSQIHDLIIDFLLLNAPRFF